VGIIHVSSTKLFAFTKSQLKLKCLYVIIVLWSRCEQRCAGPGILSPCRRLHPQCSVRICKTKLSA